MLNLKIYLYYINKLNLFLIKHIFISILVLIFFKKKLYFSHKLLQPKPLKYVCKSNQRSNLCFLKKVLDKQTNKTQVIYF